MKTLAEIFNNAFFRVPDYQRGYSWEVSQLEDFWKDLMWLRAGQQHYTGMLTLYPLERPYSPAYPTNSPHTLYHIVDGQQRLTTAFLLLKKIVKRSTNEMIAGQPIAIVTHNYLAASINNKQYSIFGYDSATKMQFLDKMYGQATTSNYKGEVKQVPGNVYERNLIHASDYLNRKLNGLSALEIDRVFNLLTTQLVFDVHYVKDTFDVCAMFESINYRGKKLTKFEVLKNRLMYLSELIRQANPEFERETVQLRTKIDSAWGRAFDWLGHGGEPLDEDDFLLNHTIMFFGPLRKEKDAVDFLLFKEKFSTDRLASNHESPLTVDLINLYVESIEKSAELWAFQNSRISKLSAGPAWASREVVDWLLRLNRIGMRHFRPMILGALNEVSSVISEENSATLVHLLREIERFVFIIYELCEYAANQSSKSWFGGYAYEIYHGGDNYTFDEITKELSGYIYSFNHEGEPEGSFDMERFINNVHARFLKDAGWYGWDKIKYFLSEWDISLGAPSCSLIPADKYDYLSVEHIMPRNPNMPGQWLDTQEKLGKRFKYIVNDMGNLVLLGIGANKAVQDIDLKFKADAYKASTGGVDVLSRSGSKYKWGEDQILERGRAMVKFMIIRWRLPGQEKGSESRIEADSILSVDVKPPRQPRVQ